MSYSTISDVLDYSRKLHEHVRNLYQQLRDQTQRERVDALLQLLSSHEETLARVMTQAKEHLSQSVLQEWHQFEPATVADLLSGSDALHADLSVDDLLSLALRIDDYLIGLYQQLRSDASSEESRKIFANLIQLEQTEKMRTVRAALSANDW